MKNFKSSKIIAMLPPSENNPRNSEGSFLRLDGNRIAFAYSRFHGGEMNDFGASDIVCIYSYDNGESFDTENVEVLVTGKEYNTENVMSVTLRRMDNGDIGLFYAMKIEGETLRTEYYLRRYKGNFSHPCGEVMVVPGRYPGYYVINNDRVQRLSNGRWMVPTSYHPSFLRSDESDKLAQLDLRGTVYCFFSDDDGFSWHTSSARIDLNDHNSGSGLREPGIVELPGGTLYGYFRTDRGYQYESVSIDGGDNWFAPRPSKFTSPDSPMLIKKNPHSGRYYAIWNPVPGYFGKPDPRAVWGRTPLVMAESLDGVHFSKPVAIEDDPLCGFCYPAIEFLDEKTLLVAYCSGGSAEKACLNRITVRKLELDM